MAVSVAVCRVAQADGAAGGPVASDVSADQLPAQVKQIFRTRCYECHGTAHAEAGVNVLDPSTYVASDGYVVAGDVDASYLFDTLTTDDEHARMPRSPLPPLPSDDIETIRRWIAAGAAEFPQDIVTEPQPDATVIGHEYVLQKIVEFVRGLPREQRRFYRFFSSNHLLTAGATRQDLMLQRQALAKAVNHLSWSADIVVPVAIDEPLGSVFAIDVRRLGWLATPWRVVHDGQPDRPASFTLFDQLLIEYPYGLILRDSDAWQELEEIYLRPAQLARPIPFLRVDWLVSTATRFPLYEDMLQLPESLPELERELGVHFATNAEAELVHRAGVTVSGVSQNNRVVERHPARFGAYWKSFDFETSRGRQNMFVDPVNFHFAGGEMIWNLPNGLQGYLITDAQGRRINEAPTSIVTDKFASDKVVRNGLACMRCHDRGMKRFVDNIRPAFEGLPDASRADQRAVLSLYVARSQMDDHLRKDEDRFLNALRTALGQPQGQEPLIPVSRRFLDAPITLSQAAGELGLSDRGVLADVFRLPEFTQLGLAGLTTGGVVRRDTWEDYFDRVVRRLGLGQPLVPIDGLIRSDHLGESPSGLTLKTNRSDNTFAPGDEMVVTVANTSHHDWFVELVGTDVRGAKTVLTPVVRVGAGQSYRFPEQASLRIQPQLGTEFLTIFADRTAFSPGTLLRGHRVADRFVHGYASSKDNSPNRITSATAGKLPTRKTTIAIQTR
ncbi:MAG: hypothetical protein NXI04_01705 [Planctomycetaceae bacterium]|nr:hypothetical protein [Planctomycetaceae bacterium]